MRHRELVLMLCLLTTPAYGQSSGQLRLGQRIWLRTAGVRGTLDSGIKGTLEGVSGDSVRLRLTPRSPAFSVFVGPQTQLFLSTGRRSSAGRGALIGGLAGSGVGALMGLTIESGGMAAIDGLLFGGVCALGGLMLGAAVPHDTWISIDWKSSVHPVISPSPHGARLGLSLPL